MTGHRILAAAFALGLALFAAGAEAQELWPGGAGGGGLVGTPSGNTTVFVTTSGAQTSGDCVQIDANGNHVAAANACVTTHDVLTATHVLLGNGNQGAAVAPQALVSGGMLILGENTTVLGAMKLFGNTSGDATITVPAVAGTSTRFQIPPDNGTNNFVLKTDGAGNTDWVAPSSGAAAGTGVQGGQSATTVGDANSAIPAGHYVVTIAALTVSRTYTLPLAATYGAGLMLFADQLGLVGGGIDAILATAGGDTYTALPSTFAKKITVNGGSIVLQSDGVSNWTEVFNSSYAASYVPTFTGSTPGPFQLVNEQSSSLAQNPGAGAAVTFHLPTIAAGTLSGVFFDFAEVAGFSIVVDCEATQHISIGANNSGSGGNVTSGAGASLRLIRVSSTQWQALSSAGSWTVN